MEMEYMGNGEGFAKTASLEREIFEMMERQKFINEFKEEMSPRRRVSIVPPMSKEAMESFLSGSLRLSDGGEGAGIVISSRQKISAVIQDIPTLAENAGYDSISEYMDRVPQEDLSDLIKRIDMMKYEIEYKEANHKKLFLLELEKRRDILLEEKNKIHEYYDRAMDWEELRKGEELTGKIKKSAKKWQI